MNRGIRGPRGRGQTDFTTDFTDFTDGSGAERWRQKNVVLTRRSAGQGGGFLIAGQAAAYARVENVVIFGATPFANPAKVAPFRF